MLVINNERWDLRTDYWIKQFLGQILTEAVSCSNTIRMGGVEFEIINTTFSRSFVTKDSVSDKWDWLMAIKVKGLHFILLQSYKLACYNFMNASRRP